MCRSPWRFAIPGFARFQSLFSQAGESHRARPVHRVVIVHPGRLLVPDELRIRHQPLSSSLGVSITRLCRRHLNGGELGRGYVALDVVRLFHRFQRDGEILIHDHRQWFALRGRALASNCESDEVSGDQTIASEDVLRRSGAFIRSEAVTVLTQTSTTRRSQANAHEHSNVSGTLLSRG